MGKKTSTEYQTHKQSGLLEFIWSERSRLKKVTVFVMLRTMVLAPIPIITRQIVDHEVKGGSIFGVIQMMLIVLGLIGLHVIFTVVGNRELSRNIPNMVLDLRARIFHKLQFMNFGFLDRTKAGRLLSKYAFDTQQVEGTLVPIIHDIIPTLTYSICMIVVITTMNPLLTVVIVLMLPIIAAVRMFFINRITQNNRQVRLARERLTGTASEYISALRLVRSLGEEKAVSSHLDSHSEGFRAGRQKQIMLNTSLGVFTFSAKEFLSILIVGVGAIMVVHGYASYGVLMAFLVALPVILMPIQSITSFSQQYFLGQESYRSIRELLDSGYVERWNGDYIPQHIRGEINFEHVCFTYDEKKPDVLHDFTLKVNAGEHVAFVGPSGSGKSTLVSLILGLYAPRKGRILVDGMPQERLAMRQFRRRCAIVMQDSMLLSGTITENIRFGQPEANMEQVREAARLAYAEDFIDELDDGFDTVVGERGVALSGGQRQRIAIARALLRNPSILILDEATSALDYESERQVQAALNNLSKGRTVITIAHRLSTVKNADRIVVLHKGHIKEVGSFEELAKLDGAFAHLLASQNTPS